MKRTKLIFETVFNLPINKYSTPGNNYHYESRYQLEFIEIPAYLPDDILKERIQREEQSYQTFESKTKHSFHTFEELHTWIFTQHSAYSAHRFSKNFIKPSINENVLKSY